MNRTTTKLIGSLALLIGSILLLRVDGWFGVGIPFGLILSILYCFDFAAELRAKPAKSKKQRFAAGLVSAPQVIFGMLCAGIGIAMVAWVLYNSLWRRDPSYSGGLLTFGMGPAFVLFGLGWIVAPFRRSPSKSDTDVA